MKYFIYETLKYKEETFIVEPAKHDWWTECRSCLFKDFCPIDFAKPYFSSDCRGRFYKKYNEIFL